MKALLIYGFDFVAAPFVLLASVVLLAVRRIGVLRLRVCKRIMLSVGVFPIRRHYYEPLFDTERLRNILTTERELPGIDLNVKEQLALLSSLNFGSELLEMPKELGNSSRHYFYHNSRFGPGDAELLYSLVRRFQPHRLIEIGSGYSTLIAREAISRNGGEADDYQCKHICIEPYEEPWLDRCGAMVLRKRVEEVDDAIFQELGAGDILFIDSSHVIRPQGDVIREYLQILPILKSGVLVHIHDIFTPRDYPPAWVCDDVRFWNEQYLMEAFLTHNADFKIICAMNFLKHNFPERVASAFPVLGQEIWREPGSFWMRRV